MSDHPTISSAAMLSLMSPVFCKIDKEFYGDCYLRKGRHITTTRLQISVIIVEGRDFLSYCMHLHGLSTISRGEVEQVGRLSGSNHHLYIRHGGGWPSGGGRRARCRGGSHNITPINLQEDVIKWMVIDHL